MFIYLFRVKLVVTNLHKIPSDQYKLHYIIEIDDNEPSLCELKICGINLEKYKYGSEYVETFPHLRVLYIDREMYEIRQVIRY